jgi:hypothetical protein
LLSDRFAITLWFVDNLERAKTAAAAAVEEEKREKSVSLNRSNKFGSVLVVSDGQKDTDTGTIEASPVGTAHDVPRTPVPVPEQKKKIGEVPVPEQKKKIGEVPVPEQKKKIGEVPVAEKLEHKQKEQEQEQEQEHEQKQEQEQERSSNVLDEPSNTGHSALSAPPTPAVPYVLSISDLAPPLKEGLVGREGEEPEGAGFYPMPTRTVAVCIQFITADQYKAAVVDIYENHIVYIRNAEFAVTSTSTLFPDICIPIREWHHQRVESESLKNATLDTGSEVTNLQSLQSQQQTKLYIVDSFTTAKYQKKTKQLNILLRVEFR